MTIDEAIAHAREVAEKNRNFDVIPEKVMDTSTFKYNCLKCAEEHEQLAEWLEELKKYREIGTQEECMASVEKQKAKKPIRNDKCTCPSCGTHNEVIKKRRNTVYSDIVYCWHCGQALKIFRSDEE